MSLVPHGVNSAESKLGSWRVCMTNPRTAAWLKCRHISARQEPPSRRLSVLRAPRCRQPRIAGGYRRVLHTEQDNPSLSRTTRIHNPAAANPAPVRPTEPVTTSKSLSFRCLSHALDVIEGSEIHYQKTADLQLAGTGHAGTIKAPLPSSDCFHPLDIGRQSGQTTRSTIWLTRRF